MIWKRSDTKERRAKSRRWRRETGERDSWQAVRNTLTPRHTQPRDSGSSQLVCERKRDEAAPTSRLIHHGSTDGLSLVSVLRLCMCVHALLFVFQGPCVCVRVMVRTLNCVKIILETHLLPHIREVAISIFIFSCGAKTIQFKLHFGGTADLFLICSFKISNMFYFQVQPGSTEAAINQDSQDSCH